MFEEEVTKYATVGWDKSQDPRDVFTPRIDEIKFNDWRNGAEFGYNKANEWHYMKDVNCYEDLHFPPEEEEKGRVLIWKVQVITENGVKLPVCYHCGSYGDLWYEINAYHVIAWKEIVLPDSYKVVKL
jgi:hypothetical protein